jgi:hypothetical protein
MQRTPAAKIWPNLRDRWATLVDACRADIRNTAAENGRTEPVRRRRDAAAVIVRLADNVTGDEVIKVALGIYLMRHYEPRAFRSDASFNMQIVRRIRGLTDTAFGRWTDPATGKTKRAAKELPSKTAEIVAELLIACFGVAGLALVKVEEKEEEAKRAAAKAHSEAIAELLDSAVSD